MRHFLEWGLLKFSLKPTQSTATIIASIIDRCFAFFGGARKEYHFLGGNVLLGVIISIWKHDYLQHILGGNKCRGGEGSAAVTSHLGGPGHLLWKLHTRNIHCLP